MKVPRARDRKKDPFAINDKLVGLTYGNGGYCKDEEQALKFSAIRIHEGDTGFINTKIEGLFEGKYLYDLNPQAARELHEYWLRRGDPGCIDRN